MNKLYTLSSIHDRNFVSKQVLLILKKVDIQDLAKISPGIIRRIKSTQFIIVSLVVAIIFIVKVFDSIVIPKVKAAPASLSFPQGVASGDVKQHSAILWTRTDRTTPVLVEVSNSALFKKFHFKEVVALPKNDFTVKVVVTNLLPDHPLLLSLELGIGH